MRVYSKKIKKGITATTITVAHDDLNKYDNKGINKDLDAIYILLGGYNELGRSIDHDVYQAIKDRFNECVSEIKSLI